MDHIFKCSRSSIRRNIYENLISFRKVHHFIVIIYPSVSFRKKLSCSDFLKPFNHLYNFWKIKNVLQKHKIFHKV